MNEDEQPKKRRKSPKIPRKKITASDLEMEARFLTEHNRIISYELGVCQGLVSQYRRKLRRRIPGFIDTDKQAIYRILYLGGEGVFLRDIAIEINLPSYDTWEKLLFLEKHGFACMTQTPKGQQWTLTPTYHPSFPSSLSPHPL